MKTVLDQEIRQLRLRALECIYQNAVSTQGECLLKYTSSIQNCLSDSDSDICDRALAIQAVCKLQNEDVASVFLTWIEKLEKKQSTQVVISIIL